MVWSTVSQHGIADGLAAAYFAVITSCVWEVFDVTLGMGTNQVVSAYRSSTAFANDTIMECKLRVVQGQHASSQ